MLNPIRGDTQLTMKSQTICVINRMPTARLRATANRRRKTWAILFRVPVSGPMFGEHTWYIWLDQVTEEWIDWSKNKSRFDIQTSSPKHLWDGLKNREDRDSQPKTHRAPNVIDHRQQCHLSFSFTFVLQHFSLDSGPCTGIYPYL